MSEWISIDSSLPNDYEAVLVYAKRKGTGEPCPVSIAYTIFGKWKMLNHSPNNAVSCGDLGDYMEEDEITHWMALPELPK